MNKTAIKNFAIQSRVTLIKAVSQKAFEIGVTEEGSIKHTITSSDALLVNGQLLDTKTKRQREALLFEIANKGFKQVMEEVAYTWFNRFIALRFMEVNGYLPSRIRVFTNSENQFKPEILTEALHLQFAKIDREKVISLYIQNKNEELYKYMLIVQCNELNSSLPEMFEYIENYTELLFPDGLLGNYNVLANMVNDIPMEDWQNQVEIIGWLYQFYNTELKNETYALLKKNVKLTKERIPSVTQLFTPDWIVRYMVENSLGRLWIEGHSNTELTQKWKYFLEEAEQEHEVKAKLEALQKEYRELKPEDIKFFEPCMGSGHILVYAFEVLMQIYTSQGYSEQDASRLILEKNLFGLDIDDRAYQLSYFAVMMKARQYNRRILEEKVKTQLCSIKESNFFSQELIEFVANGDIAIRADLVYIAEIFKNAKEFGSILVLDQIHFEFLNQRISQIQNTTYTDIFSIDLQKVTIDKMIPILHQAEILSRKYDVVVTNPPYMAPTTTQMPYVLKHFKDSKSDLFAVFMERNLLFLKNSRYMAMINQHAWMFLSSYEKLRSKILLFDMINMAHLGPRAFEEISGEVVQTTAFIMRNTNIDKYNSVYARLVDFSSQEMKEKEFLLKNNNFVCKKENFSKIPGSPIAYLANEKIIDVYSFSDTVAEVSVVKKGLATGNVDKFIKYWHEIDYSDIAFNKEQKKWYPCHKGGEFRKWYGNFEKVIFWENDGFEVKNYRDDEGKIKSRPQNIEYMFKKGIVFSKITSGGSSCRIMMGMELFDDAVQGFFLKNEHDIYNLMGILNSKVVAAFLRFLNPTLNKQIYDLERIAFIRSRKNYESIVQSLIHISKLDWDDYETSWEFKSNYLVVNKVNKISGVYDKWKSYKENLLFQTITLETTLNEILITEYGLSDYISPKLEDNEITLSRYDLLFDIKHLVSYAVGCMLGRYSLDVEGIAFAGGKCVDSKYVSFIPDEDNVVPISSDNYFEDDIVGRFVEFVRVVYGKDTLEENLNFIAQVLGKSGVSSRETIRNYFLNDFYTDHLKIYQKRPIYWLFDSGKENGFKALIYLHRYQSDLLSILRVDYVHEQQERYRTQISHLEDSLEKTTQPDRVKINRQLEKLRKQAQEIKVFEEKLQHYADQKIEINLDDGVVVNYAKFGDLVSKIK